MMDSEAIEQVIELSDRQILSVNPEQIERLIARLRFQRNSEMSIHTRARGFSIVKILPKRETYAEAVKLLKNEDEDLRLPTVAQLMIIRDEVEGTFIESYFAHSGSKEDVYIVNMKTGSVVGNPSPDEEHCIMLIRQWN